MVGKDDSVKKPLVNQIWDELFANIKENEAFDDETIQALTQLAKTNELKKLGKAKEAIKTKVAKQDEAS